MSLANEVNQIFLTKRKSFCIFREFELKPINFAKYICSLANTSDGYIIIGATYNDGVFQINGVSTGYNFTVILTTALNMLSGKPDIAYEFISVNSKNVFVIKVMKREKPIYLNSDKYVLEDLEIVKCKGEVVMDTTKVFIVHGHDNAAKQETARFIEKLGLNAIILHEQASKGLTIIEKIEDNTNVGFAVILYTPCDEGKAKGETNLNYRARQNVVFEHGYLIAKLGRKNVCALVKGDIEKPNDISGVVYITMDDNGAWKIDLAKEMKTAGYKIDFNGIV